MTIVVALSVPIGRQKVSISQTSCQSICVLNRDIDGSASMACQPIYAKSGLSANLKSA
jgi:hypothetical protein